MSYHPFAVSLNPFVQVTSTEDHYTLRSAESDPTALLTMATTPGIGMALDRLKAGNTTPDSLVQGLAELDGRAAGEQFGRMLQQLDERGWLSYAVLPLAVAIPMVDSAELNLTEPYWTQTHLTLSRFAYQHSHEGAMVLESPLSKFRIKLLDWRASAILAQLAQPQSLATLTPPPYLGPETAYQFLNLLWAAGFLTADPEPPSLQLWEFHNLLFHSRSRLGRHDYPPQDINIKQWSDFPVVKSPMSHQIVPLPRPNLGALKCNDATLTQAIETRKSIREYDETNPITIEQLSELLYRTARVKEILQTEEWFGENWRQILGFDAAIEYGELGSRPYPGGGAMYELEIYPVVRRCRVLDAGLYHYDSLNHQLERIAESEDVFALQPYIYYKPQPQVLLVITARFGRLFRKYRSVAYSLVLKHVGALQQNLYLVATNMGLAPCALGSGDSDGFGQAAGLDYVEESAVGEFMLGSLPKRDVQASGVESVQEINLSDEPAELAASESTVESDRGEAEPEPAEVGFRSSTQPTSELDVGFRSSTQATESVETTEVAVSVSEAESVSQTTTQVMDSEASESEVESDVVVNETESAAISASGVESSATPLSAALHPHDLDDRIPGLAHLRNQTLGDPRITIVVIEGNPDHSLSCFQSAEISKVFPYWEDTPEPISSEEYATFRAIEDSDRTKKEKEESLKAAFPETLIQRLKVDDHTCHVTSIIVGQENTPSAGIAPHCRLINLSLTSGIAEEYISPLNLARAFEQALDLGANIIHCGICHPTKTGEGEELFAKAVQKCLDNNILIVGPAGNGLGEYWCLPGVLPGTLPVGAMDLGSPPAHYSNWGGNYTEEGIMAPGDDIWGAQLATEKPRLRTGTSGAAPIVTGIAALLMSLQLQEGKPVDAEAVRTALLKTAIPCDPKVVEEPERCLRGFVNIGGAMKLLFGRPSFTISFAGDRVTRTERGGYAMATATAAPASIAAAMTDTAVSPALQPATPATLTEEPVTAAATPADTGTVEASTAFSGNVYALGTIGYDFGDETRRDTFQQQMAPAEVNGIMVPPDPHDPRQMVEHLDRHPDESRSLIWTLSLDGDTIYALESKDGDVYEMFVLMLAGQLEPEASDEFVERISIPARRTKRTVELFSGEVVPVVTVPNVRGMYGWKVNTLVNSAMAAISRQVDEAQEPLVRQALTAFLNRVYNDLRNVGQTSRDRALNFAATNIFQAAVTFARAIVDRRQLDTINVEKSPFCRINSDCWDVKLVFYDPDNTRRGRKVFRFTLDVVLLMPVTLGQVRSWSLPSKES
ncbi:SagB-type dehydrogenase domain protein [Oscillatoria nigro-viridis PCC 7112]|uniref:SagB-type dehydrogenase domain protein n=1 Tax=Phormidium nigroviride PCC 7112 TaxID=179408 RepID=K9VKF9_9CYAN|nr:PatA/PatG family cyanobactin maturation protease [Oscillatoria nigro-viridis]AFZ08009.1 SagB-type dehydrogenase domain protein [Oscillatoria nigro-viridis PCC 7112]